MRAGAMLAAQATLRKRRKKKMHHTDMKQKSNAICCI